MERWPALERLSGLHKALEERRKKGGKGHARHVHGDTEDPHVTAANIYMLSHSAWWEDKKTDVQRAPCLAQSHTAGKQRSFLKLRSARNR